MMLVLLIRLFDLQLNVTEPIKPSSSRFMLGILAPTDQDADTTIVLTPRSLQ